MEQELIFFIIISAYVIIDTILDSWHDKKVTDELQKLRFSMPLNKIYDLRDDSWKMWGNINALSDITFIIVVIIILTHWMWIVFWIPIHWLLWWIMHDTFTGKFILNKWFHLSSDPISQFFGRMFQQSGGIFFAGRIFILFLLVMTYLGLSFNITLW